MSTKCREKEDCPWREDLGSHPQKGGDPEAVKLKLEGGRLGVGQEVAGSGSLCKEEEANSHEQ